MTTTEPKRNKGETENASTEQQQKKEKAHTKSKTMTTGNMHSNTAGKEEGGDTDTDNTTDSRETV